MRSRLCSFSGSVFYTLLAALFLAAPGLQAQQTGTVTGRVTDGSTGQPVSSVQVYVAGLDVGVLSQQNGRFLLQNVPAGTHTLTAERIGYRSSTAEITVSGGETVVQNFTLSEEALQLEEVIVTGTPGGTERRAIGNAVVRLDAAEVANRGGVSDMQELLQGRASGVRFNGLDGQVGGGRGLTIRGVSSVNLDTQPLIYIDGVRVQNDATVGPSTGSSQSRTALDDINPNEIESIEVIKGPAAATLYGTEASAGVIQIITKRGAVGEPEFTFETTQGSNFMVDPAGTLGNQYACAVPAFICDEEDLVEVNMYDEASNFLRRDGRFSDLTGLPGEARSGDLFQYGYQQAYNLSVRGGTDEIRYYLSGSWNDGAGVLDYNTNSQTSLRANVTVLLSENLNLDVSTGYTQGDTRFATIDEEGGVWHQLVWSRPANLPDVRSDDGSGFLGFQERFPYSYEKTDVSREYSRFTGSATLTHNYGEWLNQRLVFGIDRGASTNNEYIPANADFPNAPAGSLEYGRPINQLVTLDYSVSGQYQLTEGLGTTTSFGTQYYRQLDEDVTNIGNGFTIPNQTVIDQTELNDRQVDFMSEENKSLGIYVQEEFSWQDRIFLTGAVRADDNSAFGGEFDLQYYPKVSGSWVISEEEFFDVGAIDNLRLRGAWGQSGRQPGTFAGQTLYTTFQGPDGNGLIPTNPGNVNVGPEVSSELELGFDIAMLNQRVSAEFSYYDQTTEDMLVNQSLAPSSGLVLGSREANLGSMSNWGWEASINARLVDREAVAFDLALSGDYTKNEINSLGEDVVPTDNFQIGWPYPNVATEHKLVNAEFNEFGGLTNVMCDGGRPAVDGGPPIMPGGEAIPCDDYDAVGILLGPAYPNYSVSVSPTLTLYQDLQIFALAEGQYGRWSASTDAQYACSVYRNCRQALVRDDPFFVAGNWLGSHSDDRYWGRFLADFWRMRQIGLRYTIPDNFVEGLGADRASFSLSGNNLFMIWQRNDTDKAGNPIYDPEYSINGNQPQQLALWEMPSIASFSATLRVTF